KKLVFVQMDRSTIALEVDSLIETLEFKDTAPIPVPELPDSIIGAICGEILAMENERHVLLIDVPSLFRRYEVTNGAAILGTGQEEEEDHSARLRVEEERAVFTFEVGSHALSLSMEHVLEVRSMPEKMVPAGSLGGPILGLIEIRGTVVPLIDMQVRLGIDGSSSVQAAEAACEDAAANDETEPESVVVVVQHKNEPFGLVVDRVKSMTRFHPSEASSAATAFRGPGRGRNQGLLSCVESALLIDTPVHGSQTVVLLDVGQLVRPEQS
ncbi:MAG: chemotaxis protein CheW, partial [Planctomycetota bacterium]